MPTALVSGFRDIVSSIRSIPGQWGLYPYTVSIVTKSWSGGDTGKGTATEVVTPILVGDQSPKVKPVSQRRIALGIGFELGDLTVGPITPVKDASWSTVLQQALSNKSEALVRVVHTESGLTADHRIFHVDISSALHTTLTIRPVST